MRLLRGGGKMNTQGIFSTPFIYRKAPGNCDLLDTEKLSLKFLDLCFNIYYYQVL